MSKNLKNVFLIIVVSILINGCAGAWTYISGSSAITDTNNKISILVPGGWVKANSIPKSVAVTKDGPSLQWVVAKHTTYSDFSKEMSFQVDEETLPSDLSKYYLARFKKDNNLSHVDSTYDGLKTIDGQAGFETHLEYKNERGLRYKTIAIGIADENLVYEITYTAPVLQHFDLHVNAFNKMASSFKRL